jgi:benzodiazapine receptor
VTGAPVGGGDRAEASVRMGLRIANALMLGLVLWLNGLAGSGALSGQSIGVIANQYPSYFLPANWVFGIWSLIYLWLMVFVVAQLLPFGRDSHALARIGYGWLLNGALNGAWVVTFSFGRFVEAWAIMIALLLNLIWLHERIGVGRVELSGRDRALVAWPFSLYLAWISVALIANTFQLVTYLGWDGFGIPGPVWSSIMIGVGTLLAALMVARRSNWIFPLVFSWAFLGIADRYADITLISVSAYGATIVAFAVLVVGRVARGRAST